ncbi:MAG: rhamnan synthesis F family protein [Rhizomicrobium sp.]
MSRIVAVPAAGRLELDAPLAPGRYAVRILECPSGGAKLSLRFGDDEAYGRLPAAAGHRYLLQLRRPATALALVAPAAGTLKMAIGRLGALPAAWHAARHARVFPSNRIALGGGTATLLETAAGDVRSQIQAYRSDLHFWQLGLEDDADAVRRHPELDAGWPPHEGIFRPARPARPGGIGVVVHLHYAELWDEIAACLCRMERPFDLHVGLTAPSRDLERRIAETFPGATFHAFENRGRDIGPFVDLLGRGVLDRYAYVCKLHGKRSLQSGTTRDFGARWRRHCYVELLAAPGRAERLLDAFDRDPGLGLIGPAGNRIPNRRYAPRAAWGGNRALTLQVARRMGIAEADFALDFFAGSMFWVRPQALQRLRGLGLQQRDFPPESGQRDRTLQHAIERLFLSAVRAAGYGAAESGDFD